MLGEKTPNEADPSGGFYEFERGAPKSGGGDGFADVWLEDHFGWEYKGKRKDLVAAYKQLLDYHEALGQPPLLVVCDMERFEVHTKWTNTESWVYRFSLPDLNRDAPVAVTTPVGQAIVNGPNLTAMQVLGALFEDPAKLRPGRSTTDITETAARLFFPISDELRKWKDAKGKRLVDDMRVARFITRMVFCMFATDIGLLSPETFSAILADYEHDAPRFREAIRDLWGNMRSGGRFGAKQIAHFNGELFDDDDVPEEVTAKEIIALRKLDAMNWADVEPAIFGTLFERILDANKKERAKLGAHYTSREDIEFLVEPALMAPLRARWVVAREAALAAMEQAELRGGTPATVRERLRAQVAPFLDEIATIQVLDPACGSGNFLYVSLALLKALEKEAIAFAELYGVDFPPRVDPGQLHGIEINPYAHEVANIVIWIGYLQWKHRNGWDLLAEKPILRKLHQIELKDALVDASDPAHPKEATWPKADVIIGNPPFLGGKLLRRNLTSESVDQLFAVYDGRVKQESDLCCYWFEKARAQIAAGNANRAGLLATQGIRGGANQDVLRRIKQSGHIFFAVDDREWILNGAAVHVSMVGFDGGSGRPPILLQHYDSVEADPRTGKPRKRRTRFHQLSVEGINADLTSQLDLTGVRRLAENVGIAFMGDTKVGPFEIDAETAKRMLASPNADGRSNADVVRPSANALDITRRPRGMWIVDFPPETSETRAALYEAPFAYIERQVKPDRLNNQRALYAREWWIHGEPRPGMRGALQLHPRYLVTPGVSKHRLFAWMGSDVLPDHALMAFARHDDYFFGVLQSHVHEVWALRLGTQLREASSGARYTPTTCFETFPLPWSPGAEPMGDPRYLAIAEAAKELDDFRVGWLDPPPVDGLPLAPSALAERTLTELYNQQPAELRDKHRKLDAAVFAAYGWPAGLTDQEILARLLALNLQRAGPASLDASPAPERGVQT